MDGVFTRTVSLLRDATGSEVSMSVSNEQMDRQRRIRRNVWWLVALALVFYLGFIAMSVSGARG
jgi:hypothetical protein